MALGDECWNLAVHMVYALRTFGKFNGDIRIFTERDATMVGADVIRYRDMVPLRRPTIAKALIGKDMDCSAYDRIVWMDADVVTIAPVRELFEQTKCHVASEAIVSHPSHVRSFSLPKYPCDLGTLGMNTGVITCEAQDWNAICQTWWDCIVDARTWEVEHNFGDQPAFNHLVRHGAIRAEAMPLGTMAFLVGVCPTVSKETLFVHTRGDKLEVMRCIISMMKRFLL
jgi:hypothetical protein